MTKLGVKKNPGGSTYNLNAGMGYTSIGQGQIMKQRFNMCVWSLNAIQEIRATPSPLLKLLKKVVTVKGPH